MISFIQYKRPHGTPTQAYIDRSREIEDKALALLSRGFSFEIEVLGTGDISMEVVGGGREEPLAGELVPNGPEVPEAVDSHDYDSLQYPGNRLNYLLTSQH